MPLTKVTSGVADIADCGFHAYNSTGGSVAPTTFVKIALTSEVFDTNGVFDTTNSKYVPNVPGYYQINFGARLTAINAGKVFLGALYKNGAVVCRIDLSGLNSVQEPSVAASWFGAMNGTTDYLELYVYQSDSASQTVSTGAERTYMNGFLVRRT